jgi:asparagine synthase (glutamine-hydrolysing)
MCGIALIAGPEPNEATFRAMLDELRPRGEVEEVATDARLLAGTHRLRITDPAGGVQPWISADGRYLLCLNGEIFNYRALRCELKSLGRRFRTDSDTEVVAEAFCQWGETAVRRFRGEYALAIADRTDERIYLARDPVGVKPLYWSLAAGHLYLASEIKALVGLSHPSGSQHGASHHGTSHHGAGASIGEVPPGRHGWASARAVPKFTVHSKLASTGTPDGALPGATGPLTDETEAIARVRATLADSIKIRVDTPHAVGVILSGGLDSSLLLAHVRELHPDCVAFTIGAPGSEDLDYARRLTADLGVRHEVIEIAPREIRLADVREAIRISELTEYGDIINAVVSVPLFRRIAELGIKVVLTGDGSDELFGGYSMYSQISPEQQRRLFLHKIGNLGRTELQRVDRTSMAHGVEARVPFLDQALVELAMRLPGEFKVRDGVEKWILRRAFTDLLPGYIITRPKNPMSHSSGLHERARIYKPLFARIHRSFGYDRHQPVRRDFSIVLDRCGNDLDLAIAQARTSADYTVREHARDLAGAAKWNLVGSLAGPTRNRPA